MIYSRMIGREAEIEGFIFQVNSKNSCPKPGRGAIFGFVKNIRDI